VKSFDLIIFDYDGVVADSELLNNEVLADLLTEHGLPTSVEESLTTYLGRRWLDCAPLIEARLGHLPDQLQAQWTRRCHERARLALQPVPGFEEFLAQRTQARCIASSSPPSWIEMGLSRFGVGDVFAGSIFSAAVHVRRGKPHPDIFLHAAAAMGVDPHRALVLEDTPTGVRAALSAGMTVIGLCAGGHVRGAHREQLLQAGPHHLADSYADVEDWLSAWPVERPAQP
jgi:HAD superfamily hydrolase (TIGR01509 family)